jgi:hypothetical protein
MEEYVTIKLRLAASQCIKASSHQPFDPTLAPRTRKCVVLSSRRVRFSYQCSLARGEDIFLLVAASPPHGYPVVVS